MSPFNEADTRAKLVDPKFKAALWGEGQITREHYFFKGKLLWWQDLPHRRGVQKKGAPEIFVALPWTDNSCA